MTQDNLKNQNRPTPLEELFKGFKGDPEDYNIYINWGGPVGNEVW